MHFNLNAFEHQGCSTFNEYNNYDARVSNHQPTLKVLHLITKQREPYLGLRKSLSNKKGGAALGSF